MGKFINKILDLLSRAVEFLIALADDDMPQIEIQQNTAAEQPGPLEMSGFDAGIPTG